MRRCDTVAYRTEPSALEGADEKRKSLENVEHGARGGGKDGQKERPVKPDSEFVSR